MRMEVTGLLARQVLKAQPELMVAMELQGPQVRKDYLEMMVWMEQTVQTEQQALQAHRVQLVQMAAMA